MAKKKAAASAATSKKGYKGGVRHLYVPDYKHSYTDMWNLYNSNESEAWKEYSRVRSIARKRQERAEQSDILKNNAIVKDIKREGGFPTVASLKASSRPAFNLAVAYSKAMKYLNNPHTSAKKEIKIRKEQIKEENDKIAASGGPDNALSLDDYTDFFTKYLPYLREELKKKYGPAKYLDYYDSGEAAAVSYYQGVEYGLSQAEVYKTYITWAREHRKAEQRRARNHVKNPRKTVAMTFDNWHEYAEKAGVLDPIE